MRSLIARLCALLAASSCVLAGSAITGRVLDPRGNAVPGAAVRLEGRAGFQAEAVSDAEGRYALRSVPNSEYRLDMQAPGLAGAEAS